MLQYLLVTCCLPGCLSVLANQAGSFEEFHFEKSKSEESGGGGGGGEKVTKVTMTRTTRSFSSVRRHPTVLVEDVGTEDEEMLEEQSSENSNTEGSNGGKEAPNKAFIVIDGVTGQKTKEDSVIINHTKVSERSERSCVHCDDRAVAREGGAASIKPSAAEGGGGGGEIPPSTTQVISTTKKSQCATNPLLTPRLLRAASKSPRSTTRAKRAAS